MIIIPAIDIYDNKVVRLCKGSFEQVTYYKKSPLKQAAYFESLGFGLIHIVDLLGSKEGKFTAIDSVKEIKEKSSLKIEFGGGIRDVKTLMEVFDAGVDFAIIGSLAVKNKTEFELALSKSSPDKIISAIDVKDEKIQVHGWTEDTSVSVNSHIEYCSSLGINKFLCTDVKRDGMLTGVNLELYKKLMQRYPAIKLIVSGGVKDMDDIKNLKEINPYAVVVGKALYEGKVNIEELASFAL
jgi:phosphoribosylformimino-5-aminoimidazole carboxamide ribotide isomerase